VRHQQAEFSLKNIALVARDKEAFISHPRLRNENKPKTRLKHLRFPQKEI